MIPNRGTSVHVKVVMCVDYKQEVEYSFITLKYAPTGPVFGPVLKDFYKNHGAWY